MMNKEKRSSRNSVIELDKTNKEPKRRHSSYLGK